MPNLNFYAVNDDRLAVLNAVFGLGLFRVFESYSEPDRRLCEFHTVEDVPNGPRGWFLELYVLGSGPEPTIRRVGLNPGAMGDATFRYRCEGWGLVQLYFGGMFQERELQWSHTNHNTEKRAANWAGAVPELGDPAGWDWAAVTRASGRLNRTIRRMALDKIGSHPVLPQAARTIAEANLQYEYGTGIHTTPAYGMNPRQQAR